MTLSPSVERTNFLSGKRVVIVDDESLIHLQLRKILKAVGGIVAGEAKNGEEGLATVLQERPDLVLMDLNMPVMNGLEAARRILASYSVCIVMLSGAAESEYQEQAQAVGVCGYIVKPITGDTLLPGLQAAMEKFQRD